MSDTITPSRLTLLGRKFRPLDSDIDLRMQPKPNSFGFVRDTNTIPLLHHELPMAAAFFPIVFTIDPVLTPVAIVGLEVNSNLFVDINGDWRGGNYIPQCLHYHPFSVVEEDKEYILYIDSEYESVDANVGVALFDKGKPTRFTKNILEELAQFRVLEKTTDEFMQALQDQRLLQGINIRVPFSHAILQLDSLMTISPERLQSLPANVLVDWHRRGWLASVHAQLLSSFRLGRVVELYAELHGVSPLVPGSIPEDTSAEPVLDLGASPRTVASSLGGTETGERRGFRLKTRPGRGKAF